MIQNFTTEEPVIDPAALRGLRELQEEGEPDFLSALVDMFVEDTGTRLISLQVAIRQLDALAVEGEAHALKGSCANFGARPMVAVCNQLEASSRMGDLATAPALINQLLVEFDRVRAALAVAVAIDRA